MQHSSLRKAMLIVSISSNIIDGIAQSEFKGQSDPNRCPTHPGELLRDEIIPATGKSKTEIASLSRHLASASPRHHCEQTSPSSPAVAANLAAVWRRRRQSGFVCKPHTTPGMRNGKSMCSGIPTIRGRANWQQHGGRGRALEPSALPQQRQIGVDHRGIGHAVLGFRQQLRAFFLLPRSSCE